MSLESRLETVQHGVYEASRSKDDSLPLGQIGSTAAYDVLAKPLSPTVSSDIRFAPNPHYERYLKMHKVFVGSKGAGELEEIYEGLRGEEMPRYLATAGWAAVEASLVQAEKPLDERLELIRGASRVWHQAIITQKSFNESGLAHLTEASYPYRLAIDLAFVPLYTDIIRGAVRPETVQSVYRDCLNVAQANAVQMKLLKNADEISDMNDHLGFAYECNALLAFNRLRSPTWFVIPSTVRSDVGYHHRRQTHDLSVIHQRWGVIQDVIPVEIKAAASRHQRERYLALLVRGKMHLSEPSKFRPEYTLHALTASEEGTANAADRQIVDTVTRRFIDMVQDYSAGGVSGGVSANSRTKFCDGSVVRSRHPGLSVA